MKISKLFCLVMIALTFYACSDDDTDLPATTPPEDIDNYFPLVIGNTWDYENVVMTPGLDDVVTTETLSVEGSAGGDFDLETTNPQNAGPVTSALSQGTLSKSGSQLIFTGSLGFAVEGFPALSIALNNAPIYDLEASDDTVLYTDSGSFQETIEGFLVTFNYEIETIMGDSYSSYMVNGTSYSDVIDSEIKITLEITTTFIGTISILPEQQVVVIDNYFAKDVGIIFSETDVNFDFIDLDQIPIPFEDLEFDVTQSLLSYDVELD